MFINPLAIWYFSLLFHNSMVFFNFLVYMPVLFQVIFCVCYFLCLLLAEYNINTGPCNRGPCPVHGQWEQWSSWSECSSSCGTGLLRRRRECVGQLYGGNACAGSGHQTVECETNKICQGKLYNTHIPMGLNMHHCLLVCFCSRQI